VDDFFINNCRFITDLPNAPAEGGAADSENRSSSVNNSANKENADWNKPQKLNLEPHQMKRKKKGGGYNLRKSLAWNRAFFTEEGIFFSPLSIS